MPSAPHSLRILELFQPADGGVPEHVRRLADGLVARGHRVTAGGPAETSLRAEMQASGTDFWPLGMVGNAVAPGPDRRVFAAIRRLLAQGGFDVVHTHAQKAGTLGRAAAAQAGVPALYSPHSFVYRTQLRRDRPLAGGRHALNLAVERRLGRHTAAIVACSQDEHDAAVRDGIVPAERVRVVLYGVEPDISAAPDAELERFRGDGPLLGFVAGLRDQKGLPILLDALSLVAARPSPLRFAIVGNGPLHDEVRARLARPDLRERTLLVPFAGRVEPYLAAIDAFVLPSYWEGMPIAVLEAMAMGVPVVASAVDGTPEAVVDGQTGLLVPPGDPRSLADALVRMAADPAARARMGAQAREQAGRRFTVPRMVAEVEALYLEAAASSRSC